MPQTRTEFVVVESIHKLLIAVVSKITGIDIDPREVIECTLA